MPCDYSKYPDNWKTEIRPAILERAEDHCEWCGVRNHSIIQRSTGNAAWCREASSHRPASPGWAKTILVVLTIAHLDHDLGNSDHANLAALCQRCHLRYDAPMKAAKRRAPA